MAPSYRPGPLISPTSPAVVVAGANATSLAPCGVASLARVWQRPRYELHRRAVAWTAIDVVAQYRGADLDAELAKVKQDWDAVLEAIRVKTPDRWDWTSCSTAGCFIRPWACRVWARTGFYQASGAYGFRDQLQDGMALGRRGGRR